MSSSSAPTSSLASTPLTALVGTHGGAELRTRLLHTQMLTCTRTRPRTCACSTCSTYSITSVRLLGWRGCGSARRRAGAGAGVLVVLKHLPDTHIAARIGCAQEAARVVRVDGRHLARAHTQRSQRDVAVADAFLFAQLREEHTPGDNHTVNIPQMHTHTHNQRHSLAYKSMLMHTVTNNPLSKLNKTTM
jgi:hypothetical protein